MLANLLRRQLAMWPELNKRVTALGRLRTRTVRLSDGRLVEIAFNPVRKRSSGADLSAEALAARPCFLCGNARPPEQQVLLHSSGYQLLANPFPAAWPHYTIVADEHVPQAIQGRESHFVKWMELLRGMVVFFNGAGCGASCPDHMHFQAVEPGAVPLFADDAVVPAYALPVHAATGAEAVERLCYALGWLGESADVNVLGRIESSGRYTIFVVGRRALRPACYSADPNDMKGYMVSPASLEVAGRIITPLKKDFDRIDAVTIEAILSEVTLNV